MCLPQTMEGVTTAIMSFSVQEAQTCFVLADVGTEIALWWLHVAKDFSASVMMLSHSCQRINLAASAFVPYL